MKKKFLAGFLALMLFVIAACSAPEKAPETSGETTSESTSETSSESNKSSGKTTFTYAIQGDPTSLNPITVGDRWGLTTVNMIFSPLVRVEGDGTKKFELAESLEVSEDGLTIKVNLKKDVKWSDGEAFNADDVVFTYTQKANKDNGNATQLWIGDQQIQVVKVDDFTVEFKLPSVSAAAVENVATETYIMPEHVYKDVTDFSVANLGMDLVGSGPYKLVDYKNGEYLQFEANENYYGGMPNIKTVVLRIIPAADTAKLALQKGEVDAAVVLPSDIADLDTNQITTYAFSENRVGYMGLNHATEELKDIKVRQAILFALNKEEMNLATYLSNEFFALPSTILPPNNPFATKDVEQYAQNVEKAKSLLSEAGVSGLTLRLGYVSTDPVQTLQATLIQQQLQEVGIKVELLGGEGSAYFAELRKEDSTAYHLFLGGYIMGTDPDMYRALYAPKATSNFFKYNSEAVGELFDKGAVELDPSKRVEIYNELQKTIANDAVMYPIVDNRRILAVRNDIQGVEEAGLIPIYTLEDMSKLTIK